MVLGQFVLHETIKNVYIYIYIFATVLTQVKIIEERLSSEIEWCDCVWDTSFNKGLILYADCLIKIGWQKET